MKQEGIDEKNIIRIKRERKLKVEPVKKKIRVKKHSIVSFPEEVAIPNEIPPLIPPRLSIGKKVRLTTRGG